MGWGKGGFGSKLKGRASVHFTVRVQKKFMVPEIFEIRPNLRGHIWNHICGDNILVGKVTLGQTFLD